MPNSSSSSLPRGFCSADGKRLSFRAYGVLLLICLAFFIPGLTTMPPTDRDESYFAQASKQMIESGNVVDIRIQDEHRYRKPIGIYWLQAASAAALLSPEHLNEIWAYRVPSFMSAIMAVLITASLGSLFFGPMAGFLAAIMMAGCVILNVEARQAKTDAALLATIMVAQYAMARAYLKQVKGWAMPFAFWTALGAGLLIKGPIILLIVVSTLIWLRVSDKNLSWFKPLKPWIGIPYAMLLTLPWLIAIGLASHGQFFQQSAGHDMFAKVTKGEFRGIMPPGLHLLAFPAVFFPFSLFGFLAIPDAWAMRHKPAVKFCLGWIVPAWIVFELSLTKLPHYVLPMCPAIAMLAAKAFIDGFPTLAKRRWRWLPPLIMGIWLLVGMALALGLAAIPYIIDQTWNIWQIAAGICLVAIQGIGLFLFFQRKISSAAVLAAGNFIFLACVFVVTLPSLQHIWLSRNVVQSAEAAKPCNKLQIVSATYNEPSLIFMAGTDTQFKASGELAAEAMEDDPCKIGVIDEEHAQSFADALAEDDFHPVVVGTVKGFNAGRGRMISMTLYASPSESRP